MTNDQIERIITKKLRDLTDFEKKVINKIQFYKAPRDKAELMALVRKIVEEGA